MRELFAVRTVEFHRSLDGCGEAGRGVIAITREEIVAFVRCRTIAQKYQLVLRDAPAPRFGKRSHDEACALIDRRIGDLELGVGEGDRAIAIVGRNDVIGTDWLAEPRARAGGSDLAHRGPDFATFGLSLLERLAVGGPPCILVERIDICRHDEPVALGIALANAVACIAQRVGFVAILALLQRRKLARGAQGFAPGHRANPGFSATDAIGRLVQQQDRTVPIGHCGLHAMRGLDTERFGDLPIHRIELGPCQLRDHGE